MEGLKVLDLENCTVIADDKAKGAKMAKRSRMVSPPRKKLADISNLQQPTKSSKQEAKPQQTVSLATTDYIDKLLKENMTLMKVLSERNKIIELSGIELQKLRINLQKVQQQNLQLAQANSQMLAELNSGKDRLKALQHEIGCKNGLLKARQFVVESKAKTATCVTSENQVGADKRDEAGKIFEAVEGDQPCNTKRKRRQSKNFSSGTVEPVQAKEKFDGKRFCSRRQSTSFKGEEPEQTERLSRRRQSARFKSQELEPSKDLFEITDAKFPVSPPHDEPVHESGPISLNSLVEREHEGGNNDVKDDTQGTRRKSSGKRLCEAAEKVQPGKRLREAAEKVQPCKELVHEGCSTSSNFSVKREHEEGNTAVKDESQGTGRRFSARPLRQAAEKVQSYKEIPINVKMRREE